MRFFSGFSCRLNISQICSPGEKHTQEECHHFYLFTLRLIYILPQDLGHFYPVAHCFPVFFEMHKNSLVAFKRNPFFYIIDRNFCHFQCIFLGIFVVMFPLHLNSPVNLDFLYNVWGSGHVVEPTVAVEVLQHLLIKIANLSISPACQLHLVYCIYGIFYGSIECHHILVSLCLCTLVTFLASLHRSVSRGQRRLQSPVYRSTGERSGVFLSPGAPPRLQQQDL